MLSDNIKAFRKSRGISQEALAARLKVVRQTVSKWENGLSVPDSQLLISLADALGVSVSELLDTAQEKEPEEIPSIKELAQKLEKLNSEAAARAEKRRGIWLFIFILITMISAAAAVQGIFSLHHMCSEQIIGGADMPTHIFLSAASPQVRSGIQLIISAALAAVAGFGVYHTRRR